MVLLKRRDENESYLITRIRIDELNDDFLNHGTEQSFKNHTQHLFFPLQKTTPELQLINTMNYK